MLNAYVMSIEAALHAKHLLRNCIRVHDKFVDEEMRIIDDDAQSQSG